jgi:hypothetical protein
MPEAIAAAIIEDSVLSVHSAVAHYVIKAREGK